MTSTAPSTQCNEALNAGRKLAQPVDGDEVVITGLAGFFPDSENVRDFQEKLFDKVDLISDDDRRWKLEHPEIPQRTGKLVEIRKFDAAFFGVHFKQAHVMDPMCRMLLEKSFEAVLDAGINPRTLRGSRTGVFVGACFSESEKTWFYEKLQVDGFGITGCSRAMLANRISYWFGINGPSYTVDSACSSSLYALEHAYKSIRYGHCDSAIVGGCNLCLHPYVSLQFARLGVLSTDGRCKSFDEGANGYCRSEAITVVYLQKKKDAKRIYATVVHAKTNCDGYKEQGITFPSGPLQQRLLEEFYEECQVNPSSLAWVEAHGTGTKVGDPEEVKAIENVFCVGRKDPLLIGSVKSNIGHSEPASGLCSLIKVAIAMETGFIPPNINFNQARKDIEAFHNGKIKVITEKTPWSGGLVGINSFGFGGANCHVLLKWNNSQKVNGGAPQDDVPRLVPASGRTEAAVNRMLSDVESRPVDVEYVKLFHEIHKDDIAGHIYRGFTLANNKNLLKRDIQYYTGEKRQVWFIFSGMGSQWPSMGMGLMKIPTFVNTINKLHEILKPKGVNLIDIIVNPDPKTFDNILNSFVGIAAIQIGLVDVLFSIGVRPDRIIGHSVGELGCAYADGCFTAEQMILAAYYRGLASVETQFIKGAMAAVGMGYNDVRDRCPAGIEVACHNGPDSCTISGPADLIKSFVSELHEKNVFAREVNVSNIAYHSKYIAKAGPKLLKYLQKVIPTPKPRSSKWVSTSVREADWGKPLAKTSSAEYHTNNLLNPVLFEEGCRHIPNGAITIEIAPHALLQPILRRSLGQECSHVALTQKGNVEDNVLLTGLGKLFVLGLNPEYSKLYEEVQLPVSRGTPMLSPLVSWEHSEDWYVASYRMQEKIKSGERLINVSLADDEMEFISGHIIDGRNLFPATGYLTLVWETLGMMRGELYTEVPVVFENVRFIRATNIPKEGNVDFLVMVQKGSGNFEVVQGGTAIVSGRVYVPEDINKEMIDLKPIEISQEIQELPRLTSRDIYKELRLRGYHYKGLFKSMISTDNLAATGKIAWHNNWVAFMDNMLQLQILQEDTRGLFVPTSIRKLAINVKKHVQDLFSLPEEEKELPICMYKDIGVIKSGGVEIQGLKASAIARKKATAEPVLETYQFVPHENNEKSDVSDIVRICVHLVLENVPSQKVKTVEVLEPSADSNTTILTPIINKALGDLPLIQADNTILSDVNNPLLADLSSDILIEDKKLATDQTILLLVTPNVLSADCREALKTALASVKESAFILAREKSNVTPVISPEIKLCAVFKTESEKFYLVRKVQKIESAPVIINIPEDNFSWLPILQAAVKAEDVPSDQRIIVYAQNEPFNGIIGLINCLRREISGDKIRAFLILDKDAPPFDINNPFYKEELSKDLAVNVYKDGKWGSYRHLLLQENALVETHHKYVNVLTRGDLSSLAWLEGNIRLDELSFSKDEDLVTIYYSALNFRDIMTASGRLANEVVARGRMNQDCVQGLEYSGRDSTGRRVMGMVASKALSSMLIADRNLLWEIPDSWTLEDAATVPVVYGTVIFALVMAGRMSKGDSVLIHAGSGGVGQAAINVALHAGCTVFTTVGTQEKRQFIRQTFPQIPDSHIGNSRSTSFEEMVMRETNGRGVDMVLNSLSEEKLQASVRCLAKGGRFLEIGKFDLANNNPLGMEIFLRETSFHGIMLDNLFSAPRELKIEMNKYLLDGIKSGAVKPLSRTVFPADEVEPAFRFMAAGKHIGKVLLQIREEETQKIVKPSIKKSMVRPHFYCNTKGSYIVLGGLGGFGLELADWLVLRGAKNIILTSRKGVRTGYQAMRIRIWQTYGVKVFISTQDVTTRQGVQGLIEEASRLGPVIGIFNLAVVLKDGLFENQTEADFIESFGPKATATKYLDEISRRLCPHLEQFVIFSSVSCGRGNPGQTNYGMANSVMERICEARRKDNLPGLSIQWGAVGDVGLVAEMQEDNMELVILGTLQQGISNCLELMDTFLKGSSTIVSSIIVAEKRTTGGIAGNIIDTVANILGLRDLKTISLHSTLAELGMDSMMAVEIKQTLEREFEVFLTPQDIRGMTFSKLKDIAAQESAGKGGAKAETKGEMMPQQGIAHLIRVIGDELTAGLPVVRLPSLIGDGSVIEEFGGSHPTCFLIPGVEGVASVVEPLAAHLSVQALCLQFNYEIPFETVEDLAKSLLPHVLKRLRPGDSFNLVGYSFGGLIAMELAVLLEKEGFQGKTVLIDSSPDFLKMITEESFLHDVSETNLQVQLLMRFIAMVWPQDTQEFEDLLRSLPDWKSRLNQLIESAPDHTQYSKRYQKLIMNAAYHRVKSVLKYNGVEHHSMSSPTTLIRPSEVAMHTEEDYGLSKYTKEPVSVIFVEGNHFTVLENKKAADIINKVTGAEDTMTFKKSIMSTPTGHIQHIREMVKHK